MKRVTCTACGGSPVHYDRDGIGFCSSCERLVSLHALHSVMFHARTDEEKKRVLGAFFATDRAMQFLGNQRTTDRICALIDQYFVSSGNDRQLCADLIQTMLDTSHDASVPNQLDLPCYFEKGAIIHYGQENLVAVAIFGALGAYRLRVTPIASGWICVISVTEVTMDHVLQISNREAGSLLGCASSILGLIRAGTVPVVKRKVYHLI